MVRLRECAPVLLSLVALNFLAECGELLRLVGGVLSFFFGASKKPNFVPAVSSACLYEHSRGCLVHPHGGLVSKTGGFETALCWKFCVWPSWHRAWAACGDGAWRSRVLCQHRVWGGSAVLRWVKLRRLIALPPPVPVRARFLQSGGRRFVSVLTELESA